MSRSSGFESEIAVLFSILLIAFGIIFPLGSACTGKFKPCVCKRFVYLLNCFCKLFNMRELKRSLLHVDFVPHLACDKNKEVKQT